MEGRTWVRPFSVTLGGIYHKITPRLLWKGDVCDPVKGLRPLRSHIGSASPLHFTGFRGECLFFAFFFFLFEEFVYAAKMFAYFSASEFIHLCDQTVKKITVVANYD